MKNRNLDHKDDWATPPEFIKELEKEFGKMFDPCPFHHDINDFDGLEIEWGKCNFINPPYSQKIKEAFVRKAFEESKKGKVCVMLLPVSTSTKLFHEVILPSNPEIRFLKGRLKFRGTNSKGQKVNYHLIGEDTDETIMFEGKEIPLHTKNSGMHDSMLVILK